MKCWLVVALGCLVACGDQQAAPDAGAPPADSALPAMLALSDSNGQPITQLDLGMLAVGDKSTASLRVTNTGAGPTGTLRLAISGSNIGDFAIDSSGTTCGASLAPQQACMVTIDFLPSATGPRSASLAIDGGDGGIVEVPLLGGALVSELAFAPPGNLDFGKVEVTIEATQTIELDNVSTELVPIDSIATTVAAFQVAGTTCGVMLAPLASCEIMVSFRPTVLGTVGDALTVTSGASMTSAPLSGDGARSLAVVSAGAGHGTVTSSPAGVDCGATCAGLFDADVVLTATPDAGSAFSSWSDPDCGSSPTCTVSADVAPVSITATFAPIGDGELDLTFAGSGAGAVEIDVQHGATTTTVYCAASCTVPTSSGDALYLTAAVLSASGAIAGACTSTPPVPPDPYPSCSFTAPGGTSAATVTFTQETSESWAELFPDAVIAVAHDTSGNVILATTTQVIKLTSTGAVVWTTALTTSGLATGPSDTIDVVSGSNVEQLDSSGAVVWTAAVDPLITGGCDQQCIAVAADGSVVVKGANDGLALWDSTGTEKWAVSLAPSSICPGLAIDSDNDVIYAATDTTDFFSARRFQLDGTELADWADEPDLLYTINGEYPGNIGIDSDDEILGSWQGFGQSGFQRTTSSGPVDYQRAVDDGSAETDPNGVTASAIGRIAWWRNWGDGSDGSYYYINVFANDNTDVWSLSKEIVVAQPRGASYAGTQLVIGGSFGFGSNGFVQAFTP